MSKNYTKEEEICIVKLLGLVTPGVSCQTRQEIEDEALERGVRFEECKCIAAFLLDNEAFSINWLASLILVQKG